MGGKLVQLERRLIGGTAKKLVDQFFVSLFTEGERVYPTSGFYEKTHIQICVCSQSVIKGVFRVPRRHLRGS